MWEALKRILRNVLASANLLVVLLFVLSAYSDHVSPHTSILFSFLGLAFPVLALITLLFVFYWLFLGHWKYLLIGICSFLICWGPVNRYYPFHTETEIPEGKNTLKVLTYNIMAFGYKGNSKEEPNKILEYIANSDADIVCLQEYAVNKLTNLNSSRIYKALKMYPYHSVFYLKNTKYQNMGIALFSKYPISKSRRIKYESDANGSSMHEVTVNGKRLLVINNHLESFKLTMEDRSRYSDLISSFDADKLQDMRGSISNKLSTAFRIRARQAEAIAEVIREEDKEAYVLVGGDFNDTPISYAHRTIQGPLLDAFAESGSGVGITYNQNFFWFRIDNILHSQNIRSSNCQVEKIPYSDHYPLSCYITLE